MGNSIDAIQELNQRIKRSDVLFFDFDGTLVHTDYANFLSYSKAIQQVIQSDIEITYKPNERFNRSVLKRILPTLPEAEYQKIVQLKETYYKEHLPETKLNTLLVDILIPYSKTNKTILVTNCREERATMTLNHYDLLDKFDHTFYRQISENENKINKYENALSFLKMAPNSVLIFENEKSEISDAILAGIPYENILSF